MISVFNKSYQNLYRRSWNLIVEIDLKYKLRKFDKVPVVSFVRYTVVTIQAMAFFVALSCIED